MRLGQQNSESVADQAFIAIWSAFSSDLDVRLLGFYSLSGFLSSDC